MSCAVFQDIPEGTVQELCSRGRAVSYDAGQKLFERGEDAKELLILQEGTVDLLFPVQIMGVCREVPMEFKQAGDVVAWSAMVPPYHFTLSARCASHSTVMALSREAIYTFFETDAGTGYQFMRNLAGVIGRRLQAMQVMWMRDLEASAVKRLG